MRDIIASIKFFAYLYKFLNDKLLYKLVDRYDCIYIFSLARLRENISK